MTTTQGKHTQPEALRLADALYDGSYLLSVERYTTADELRRLHAYAQELESQVIADCMTHDAQPAAPQPSPTPQADSQPAPVIESEAAAYNEWFSGQQGAAYDGMWTFARAAWMARAARAQADSVLEDAARWQALQSPDENTIVEAMEVSCLTRPSVDDDGYVRSILNVFLVAARKQGDKP